MSYLYQHLVALGLYRDFLSAAVVFIAGHAFLWRPFKKHREAQKNIEDLLNTSTPGGLTEVVNAIKEKKPGA